MSTSPRVIAPLTLAALLLSLPAPRGARANDSAFSESREGSAIFPIRSTTIALLAERVVMSAGATPQDGFSVEATFDFENQTSEPVTVSMGFPVRWNRAWGPEDWDKTDAALEAEWRANDLSFLEKLEFESLVDGEKVVTEKRKGMPGEALRAVTRGHAGPEAGTHPERWGVFTWSVSFAPHQQRRLVSRYRSPLATMFNSSLDFSRSFRYIARTGALWKGKIPSASFLFTLPGPCPTPGEQSFDSGPYYERRTLSVQPKGSTSRVVQDGSCHIEWSFKDWKPTTDFELKVEGKLRSLCNLLLDGFDEALENMRQRRASSADRGGRTGEGVEEPPAQDARPTPYTLADLAPPPEMDPAWYLRLKRNWIAARHGHAFQDPALQAVFKDCWQRVRAPLSKVEERNMQFIRSLEEPEPRSGLAFALVPGGKFAYQGGGERAIAPFRLGITEVTVEAYERCVRAGTCAEPAPAADGCNWGSPRRDHPMNCVSQAEATAFCRWAGGTLPREEDWEYAASVGNDGRRYPWGEVDPGPLACWGGPESGAEPGGLTATCPVGAHAAGDRAWGLHDLAGNVAEWTSGTGASGKAAVRGGSWADQKPAALAARARQSIEPGARLATVGFRCRR